MSGLEHLHICPADRDGHTLTHTIPCIILHRSQFILTAGLFLYPPDPPSEHLLPILGEGRPHLPPPQLTHRHSPGISHSGLFRSAAPHQRPPPHLPALLFKQVDGDWNMSPMYLITNHTKNILLHFDWVPQPSHNFAVIYSRVWVQVGGGVMGAKL